MYECMCLVLYDFVDTGERKQVAVAVMKRQNTQKLKQADRKKKTKQKGSM